MTDEPQPDTSISEGDPGDETANRYWYQWGWTAIVCCGLLDASTDILEVFCEHHEDILIKKKTGLFVGIQVKTRAQDQDVWKANDETFRSVCAKFTKLDKKFPGQFNEFQFLTNHPLHGAQNSQGPSFVLLYISEAAASFDASSKIGKWVTKVAREAESTVEEVIQALSKTTARDNLPKMQDIVVRLVQSLTDLWPEARERTYQSVQQSGMALIDYCCHASSLGHLQLLPSYLTVSADPIEVELAARIEGKRLNMATVMELLSRGARGTALLASPDKYIEPGEGSLNLLIQKLNAGGFSAVSLHSAEDLRDKAEYHGIKWTKEYGKEEGLKRYNHVRSLVLSDAARSFEATTHQGGKFGPEMREDLRNRFATRINGVDQVFDCSEEHLEGIAYSLTAQCKVQWSFDRPWEES